MEIIEKIRLYIASALICFCPAQASNGQSDCLLSDYSSPFPWVVSIRNINTEVVHCVGSLIAKNFVISPVNCFMKPFSKGYYPGYRMFAIHGTNKTAGCVQERKGKRVMANPALENDHYQYNLAFLETEDFNFNHYSPPTIPLPSDENSNIEYLKELAERKARCKLPIYDTQIHGIDNKLNNIIAQEVAMIARIACWNEYCPSGNAGCLKYFWTSDAYACGRLSHNEKSASCSSDSVGSPLVCEGKVVGFLKSCWHPKPVMIQGFNDKQLNDIRLYQNISADDKEDTDTFELWEPDEYAEKMIEIEDAEQYS